MKNRIQIGAFALGLAVFSYLVWRFGVDQIIANAHKAGWSLLYVILVWLVIYLLNTIAWKLVLGEHGKGVGFLKLFSVTVSGFVLNYLTPVVALGGEPYKVKVLDSMMDTKQSLSAVVLYRMVHLLGHMLLLFTGVLLALLALPLPATIMVALGCSGVLLLGVIVLTFSGHRHGVFERMNKLLRRIPFLRKAAGGIEKYEGNLAAMDGIITGVYRHQRGRFYSAILVEYVSRGIMGLEVYLILHGIGIETTIASAMFLYVVYSILINLLFFIPMNVGAREGGLYLGPETPALPPLLGVYLGIVMRIREFFWIMLGLLFILFTKSRSETPDVVRS